MLRRGRLRGRPEVILLLGLRLVEPGREDQQLGLVVGVVVDGTKRVAAELPILAAVCEAAAVVVERAIVDAILSATSVADIPAYRDVLPSVFGR